MRDRKYTLQVAPEDCTGCTLCVEFCPVKDKSQVKRRAINMVPQPPIRETEAANWDFFLGIPETDRAALSVKQVKDVQLLRPLFEFSGACSGCGETPYIKLMTQLFGDRMYIGNATGCSSIYGGNLPTTPYCINAEGRGPTWSNSLFEDNAEFGLGMRLAVDAQNQYARELVTRLGGTLGDELVASLLNADQTTEPGIFAQRDPVNRLQSGPAEQIRPRAGDAPGWNSGRRAGREPLERRSDHRARYLRATRPGEDSARKAGRRWQPRSQRSAGGGRRAGQEKRVDPGRRRLGL